MPPPHRPPRHLDRSQLPDHFTPESVRAMGMRTARFLARPDNGILTRAEQVAFDRALREVLQSSTDRLGRSVDRDRRVGGPPVDPELRRSYLRTQRRLDEQAARARRAFPQLTEHWDVDDEPSPLPSDEAAPIEGVDRVGPDGDGSAGPGDDVSIGTFEREIDQASDTLAILEQIAAMQQQQLDHQRTQVRSDTRSVFFALAVSVAVIVAGVAPLVSASPDDRVLILVWTAVVCSVAGLVYAVVRAVQSRSD